MSVLALVGRLVPHIEKELNLVIKSKEEVESLSSKLKKIHGGLHDAERDGVTNTAVKDWLKQLEAVTHEMEDVLDEWEILNWKIEMQCISPDPSGFSDKVRSLLFYLCSCFKYQVLGRRQITQKIQALTGRIDDILSERGRYTFVSEKNPSPEFRQEPSTSFVPQFGVYGRDAVKDDLVWDLMMKKVGEVDTQIVSIVGIGGVGKTTLAQIVYNDVRVKGFFNLKGWVSVSEPFDASVVGRSILEAFGENCGDAQNFESLVHRIKNCVRKKRFLLVLDNVWTEERQKWENLKNCLDGRKGSRILVTTRFKSVAIMMGTTTLRSLAPLSESECSKIVNGIALRGRKSEKQRRIGVEIAKKCNGLPLAAMTVGSMLASKSSEEEWRSVLESPLWTYDGEASDIFRALNLSYIELSPILKMCFLSSVFFPKGALVSIDEMIRIWMAYGFLNSKANNFDHEVRLKGLQYLRNLEMRSFFQKFVSEEDGENVEGYKVHDIMHEFASHILENDEYRFTFIKEGRALRNLPPTSLWKLRTVKSTYLSDEDKFPLGALSHVKSVRVLSLHGSEVQLVPEEVGELFHLRYLDLSGNHMDHLPYTLCNLYHLQTLVIEDCFQLRSLPEGIEKLVNLRHILNSRSPNLVEYPQGLEKLSGLWTLSEFRGSKLGYLRNLNQLRGVLDIYFTDSDDVEQVLKADLWKKTHIEKLMLNFSAEGGIEGAVVEALQPPTNLQTLDILATSGKWVSHWIGKSFENLKIVTFSGTFESSNLPPFGALPALEQLEIGFQGFKRLTTREFLGRKRNGFPRLKKLCFIFCREWQVWEDVSEGEAGVLKAMARLEELEINDCDKLRALPRSLLQHATSLKVVKLSCGTSASRLMRYGGGGGHVFLPNVKWVVNANVTSSTPTPPLHYSNKSRFRRLLPSLFFFFNM